jgi:adenylyltransferase/sulfurtransferase
VSRYSRQELFSGIGATGQDLIRSSRVVVVGCGALGSILAETMARAGVGELTLVDRDYVEPSNLQRQALFTEEDARKSLPKAMAAEARLAAINSDVRIRGVLADFSSETGPGLVRGASLLLDGTDNFETRFLLNDLALEHGIPWVYGACVGAYGLALLVQPRKTPCLRCILEEMPPAGSGPTCDTAGVVAPIVQVIAGIQGGEALKILAGHPGDALPGVVSVDLWKGTFDVLDLRGKAPWCPACTEARYDYLGGPAAAAVLCGRDAVQIRPPRATRVELPSLARRLSSLGEVTANAYLVRFQAPEGEIVVFEDGRALVKGTGDPSRARALFSKYVGN